MLSERPQYHLNERSHATTERALPEALREEFRHRLAVCLTVARSYDGTEPTYQRLTDTLATFENWEHGTFSHYFHQEKNKRLNDEAEATLLQAYHPTVASQVRTISGLLDLSQKRLNKRLIAPQGEGEDILQRVRIQPIEGVLLPPGKQLQGEAKDVPEPYKETVFFPRLRLLLAAFQDQGIFLDDVLVWVGETPRDSHRKAPYVLVEIPRLGGREVLVCDQVGEATFVSRQPLDPKTFFTLTKDQLLKRYPDVKKIVHQEDATWQADVLLALTEGLEVGDKIDIHVRERVRDQIKQRYEVGELVDEDGKMKISIIKAPDFLFEGRRFTALTSLFGLKETKERTMLNMARLMIAIYGPDERLGRALTMMEKDLAVQEALATDREKWIAFIKGESVSVRLHGIEMSVVAEHPFPTKESFFALTWQAKLKLFFAGMGWQALSAILLPVASVGNRKNRNNRRNQNEEDAFAAALYGVDADLERSMQKTKNDREMQKEFGRDPGKWRPFIKGRYPTYNDFLSIPSSKRVSPLFAGVGLQMLGREVFSSVDPRLFSSVRSNNPVKFHQLAAAIYADDAPEASERAQRIDREQATKKDLGFRKEEWRRVVKEAFPDPEQLLRHLSAKERVGLFFMGIGLRKLYQIMVGESGDAFSRAGRDKLVYALYYEEDALESVKPEALALKKSIETHAEQEAILNELGTDEAQWGAFLRGKSIQGDIHGKKVVRKVEKAFLTKRDFLSMKHPERRAVRVCGIGLVALAARLGIEDGQNVFSRKTVFQALADKLYPA